nr:unknown [Zea mays]
MPGRMTSTASTTISSCPCSPTTSNRRRRSRRRRPRPRRWRARRRRPTTTASTTRRRIGATPRRHRASATAPPPPPPRWILSASRGDDLPSLKFRQCAPFATQNSHPGNNPFRRSQDPGEPAVRAAVARAQAAVHLGAGAQRHVAPDGGVGAVPARGVPRPPALAADAGEQPPEAADRGARAGQDLQRCSSGGTEEGDREAEANLPPAEPEERQGARRGPVGPRRQGHDRQRGDRRARPALVMRRRWWGDTSRHPSRSL